MNQPTLAETIARIRRSAMTQGRVAADPRVKTDPESLAGQLDAVWEALGLVAKALDELRAEASS